MYVGSWSTKNGTLQINYRKDIIKMFGEKLQELRKSKNLSQTQLARILNLDKSTICGYENNIRLPSLDTLKAIARFFHTTTDFLLDIEHERQIDVSGLSNAEVAVIEQMVTILQEKK